MLRQNNRRFFVHPSTYEWDDLAPRLEGSFGTTINRGKPTKDRLYLYTTEACTGCTLRERCTTEQQRRVSQHYDEDVLNEVAERTDVNPLMMRRRKGIVEHPFGTR